MSNILIIDDEKAIRKTLTEILSYEGYKIEEAGDGEEGLKKFREKAYDVVLCDIKMPKLDGIEFLDKAREANPDVPVIMISGHGTIETAVEAVKKGAYDYISNHRILTACSLLSVMPWIKPTWLLRQKC
ncbi:MAG: response regulator [Flavitalea sp.]